MKTARIIQKEWLELPTAYRERELVPSPVRQPQTAPVPHPSPLRIAHAANRWLNTCFGRNMVYVKPLTLLGRVAVVEFVPVYGADPIMPVPLVKMSGLNKVVHNYFYRRLAQALMNYTNETLDPGLFYRIGVWAIRFLSFYIGPYLTQREHEYYVHQLWECVTHPKRNRDLYETVQFEQFEAAEPSLRFGA